MSNKTTQAVNMANQVTQADAVRAQHVEAARVARDALLALDYSALTDALIRASFTRRTAYDALHCLRITRDALGVMIGREGSADALQAKLTELGARGRE